MLSGSIQSALTANRDEACPCIVDLRGGRLVPPQQCFAIHAVCHMLLCCAVPCRAVCTTCCLVGKAYHGDPPRHPSYLVHCFKPFNGETPHTLLADAFLTPPQLFYVSAGHLPPPPDLHLQQQQTSHWQQSARACGVQPALTVCCHSRLTCADWSHTILKVSNLQV